MWPFDKWNKRYIAKLEERRDSLPDHGTVTQCEACGSTDLKRQFDDGWFAGDKVDFCFNWVICGCGWRRGEKLFRDSQQGKGQS